MDTEVSSDWLGPVAIVEKISTIGTLPLSLPLSLPLPIFVVE